MAPKAVLIGLPGSGKSTIGRRLAKAMGLTLLDTDAVIEARTGRTIDELLGAHPRLTREGVLAALRFGAEVMHADVVYPLSASVA